MAQIHPSSIIEAGADIADDVTVGPFCYIGANVRLGPGTRLISHVTILGPATLGRCNTVWPQAVLGGVPQDLKYHGEQSQLVIGDHNDIRENVTMHRGTEQGGSITRVGNENLIMAGAHVAHDCAIGDHVILSNNVQLAGHVKIENHANIAGLCGVQSYATIGQYAYVGGMSRIVHDVPPFMIVEGNPCRVRGVNVIGLKRHRFDEAAIERLKDAYHTLFRGPTGDFDPDTVANLNNSLTQLEQAYGDDECIGILVHFMRNTAIGVFGRYEESTRTDNRFSNPVK